MGPIVDGTVVLLFSDGEHVVPHWWAALPGLRQAPEHGNRAPALPFTRAEAQDVVNKGLEQRAIGIVMSRWIAEARYR